MKVRVSLVIEFDPENWTTAFGVEGNKAIREDVRLYVTNGIQQWGVFGNGEVPADVQVTS